MRIVGGEASGRKLVAPLGRSTRPTGARVREALFNSLAAVLPGAQVLDLYAGTGALGLEALSWGASSATLVEPDPKARRAIAQNVSELAMSGRVDVLPMKAEGALRRLAGAGRQFDVVFCDPPWRLGLTDPVRRALAAVLANGGQVIVEDGKWNPPVELPDLDLVRTRAYGDTRLLWYRRTDVRDE